METAPRPPARRHAAALARLRDPEALQEAKDPVVAAPILRERACSRLPGRAAAP